ncbi:MAG TPA: class I SAM-dependent methyltransferase [Patescibacteria group bacterium]|nr:class I SAM-dependent methyltransferase [Patescibacteria group bacterium]
MTNAENPWDTLAPQGEAAYQISEPEAWYDADNLLLAEPVILEYLASQIADPSGVQALDFGCGDGRFAARLSKLGYTVQGVDSSSKIIAAAQARYGTEVSFNVGGIETIPDEPTYNVVTSLMTLQFIADFEPAIRHLAAALKPGGTLVLAVFNPEFISDWIKAGDADYVGFDSVDNPTKGTLQFGPVEIPTYIRTAAQYNKLAASCELAPALEAYPPFTEEFLAKYPVNGPTVHPEHMILAYQKSEAVSAKR